VLPFRYIVIRDDDICRFTSLDQFQRVHRFLLEEKIPLTVAVIPRVSDRVSYRPGVIEGFIPSSFAGKGKTYPIGENKALVDFIRQSGWIEVAQHGFTHEGIIPFTPEFLTSNYEEIVSRLETGKAELTEVFDRAPLFFVPPCDQVSPIAMKEIRRRFLGISLSRISHRLLPFYLWPSFKLGKWQGRFLLKWGKFMILQHPGMDWSTSDLSFDPFRVRMQWVRDVLVLPLHSWKFFDAQGHLILDRLVQWENILKYLYYHENIQFVRFSDLWRQKHGAVSQTET